MINIDLDNIEFYTPDPPPARICGAFQPITSAGVPTGNYMAFTLPSAIPAFSKNPAQTGMPEYLERSLTSTEAPAPTDSTI
jgi:hypothetical protein